MTKLEEKIITKDLYVKSVEWMHDVDKISDKKLVDQAVDIIFELHQCYHGRTSSLYTEDE